MTSVAQQLDRAWRTPGSSVFYAGASRLRDATSTTRAQVDRFLDDDAATGQQRFGPRRAHARPDRRYIRSTLLNVVEVDTFFLQRYRGPFHYLLVVIEQTSGLLAIAPMKRRNALALSQAFGRILDNNKYFRRLRIAKCLSDDGTEFKGVFRLECAKRRILKLVTSPQDTTKASLCERAIGTLRTGAARAFNDPSARWKGNVVGMFRGLVERVNQSSSRAMPSNLTPSDLVLPPGERTRANASLASCAANITAVAEHRRIEAMDADAPTLLRTWNTMPRFAVGDRVRVTLRQLTESGLRGRLEISRKQGDQQFSTRVYTIVAILPTSPLPSYKLRVEDDDDDEPLPGSFAESALVAA